MAHGMGIFESNQEMQTGDGMNDRMRDLLKKWADMLAHEDTSMDLFLFEGYDFLEGLELMDHVAQAVREYIDDKLEVSV